MLVEALREAWKLEHVDPDGVVGLPPGMYADMSLAVPASRVPAVGWSQQLSKPSCIGYALASENFKVQVTLPWQIGVADHADLVLRVPLRAVVDRPSRRMWQPMEGADTRPLAAAAVLQHGGDESGLRASVLELQEVSRQPLTVHARRSSRHPMQVKSELRRADTLECGVARQEARKKAWCLLKKHV